MENRELEELLLGIRERLSRIEEKLQPTKTCVDYREAAERIGVGLTKLKSMVRNGQIRRSLVGDSPMIAISEIERVCAPQEERPRIEKRQRQATWVPISKKKP